MNSTDITIKANEIVEEVLERLGRCGVLSLDNASDEAIQFIKEHTRIGVELILRGEE